MDKGGFRFIDFNGIPNKHGGSRTIFSPSRSFPSSVSHTHLSVLTTSTTWTYEGKKDSMMAAILLFIHSLVSSVFTINIAFHATAIFGPF